MAQDGHSAGQDARLYGRQDACRYMGAVLGCALQSINPGEIV
jgi:hypothetical protein